MPRDRAPRPRLPTRPVLPHYPPPGPPPPEDPTMPPVGTPGTVTWYYAWGHEDGPCACAEMHPSVESAAACLRPRRRWVLRVTRPVHVAPVRPFAPGEVPGCVGLVVLVAVWLYLWYVNGAP